MDMLSDLCNYLSSIDAIFGSNPLAQKGVRGKRCAPPFTFAKGKDAWKVAIEMPGVKKGDVSVHINGCIVGIVGWRYKDVAETSSGKVEEGGPSEGKVIEKLKTVAETSSGKVEEGGQSEGKVVEKLFMSALMFEACPDVDRMTATMSDGLLRIVLPPVSGKARMLEIAE